MIGLGVLALVGIFALVVFLERASARHADRHRAGQKTGGRRGASSTPSPEVESVLARAVAAHLLSEDAAAAIVAAERERAPAGSELAHGGRVTPVAEAIGYVGGILVVVGLCAIPQRLWNELATGAQLAAVGAAAVLLFATGAFLRDEDDPVIWRLRGVLWLLSAGAVAGFMGVLTVNGLDWRGEPVAVAIGAALAVYGAALWQRKNRPAQHLTVFVGLLVMVGGGASALDGAAAVGLVVLAIAVIWLVLGYRELLPPTTAALLLGSVACLVGAAITSGTWHDAGPLLGLAAATALVGTGTVTGRVAITGAGVVGLFVFLPWTLAAVFGDAIGPPVVFVASGALLLGVMGLLVRRHSQAGVVGTGRVLPPHAA